MSNCAHRALTALLAKSERAWSRQSERGVTLAFTEGGFPEYLSLPSREAKSATHATLRNAARSGAIIIEWDRHAGDDGQVLRLRVADADGLAAFVGEVPLWTRCEQAAKALALNEDSPAEVRALHAAWCAGKSPRKLGPDRVGDFVDALAVIAACETRGRSEDIAVRRLSVELFGDTKRIEAITPALDALTGGLSAPPRSAEEVWAALGLVKFPQPVLVAGPVSFALRDSTRLTVAPPFLGIPADTISGVELPSTCRYLLTVENLTTFNELARGRGGALEGCVVYTGGMPSPTLLSVYRKLVAALSSGATLWHWGDIDLGGLRIAALLHATADLLGRSLRPFNMNPALIRGVAKSGELGSHEAREMARVARSLGWEHEANGIETAGVWYEQEALPPALPAS